MRIWRLGIQDKKTADHFIFVRDSASSVFGDKPLVRRLNSLASIGADKASTPLSQCLYASQRWPWVDVEQASRSTYSVGHPFAAGVVALCGAHCAPVHPRL